MIILRNNNFSHPGGGKKEDKPKMKFIDRANVWATKHLMSEGERNNQLGINKNDPEAWRKARKRGTIIGAAVSVVPSAAFGYCSKGLPGAVAGGIAGAGIGAGLNYGAYKLSQAIRTKSMKEAKKATGKKFWKNNEERFKKNSDLISVANGDMTESEFAKKWNNKKK